MKKQTKNTLEWVFLISCTILFIVVLVSCNNKTIYVPVETTKIEYKDRWQRDSILLLDSVFVDRWRSGDTIYLTKEKYKYLYRDKLVVDSVYISDTIKVPYPVVEIKTVKAPYSWYEKILLALGCVGIGLVGYNVFRWMKK